MKLDCYEYHPKEAPRSIIILLHGVGSNGQDLFGLIDQLRPIFPDTVFISPDAPEKYDMAPMGYQWYSLRDMSIAAKYAGVKAIAPAMHAFLDTQVARFCLTHRRLGVIGFSQGCMTALYCAITSAHDWAGVAGFSGGLLGEEYAQTKRRTPIHLVHGEMDEVVPVERYHESLAKLAKTDIPLSNDLRPNLGHSIDGPGLRSAVEFLRKNLD
ncbi:MAG: dienelactone hydrolase family protein [Pseudomonadota bacterium]